MPDGRKAIAVFYSVTAFGDNVIGRLNNVMPEQRKAIRIFRNVTPERRSSMPFFIALRRAAVPLRRHRIALRRTS